MDEQEVGARFAAYVLGGVLADDDLATEGTPLRELQDLEARYLAEGRSSEELREAVGDYVEAYYRGLGLT